MPQRCPASWHSAQILPNTKMQSPARLLAFAGGFFPVLIVYPATSLPLLLSAPSNERRSCPIHSKSRTTHCKRRIGQTKVIKMMFQRGNKISKPTIHLHAFNSTGIFSAFLRLTLRPIYRKRYRHHSGWRICDVCYRSHYRPRNGRDHHRRQYRYGRQI